MKKITLFLVSLLLVLSFVSCTKTSPITPIEKEEIFLGKYPQSKVTDVEIIKELRKITTTTDTGYIEYNENEYLKQDDIYFLVEPIKWIKYITPDSKTYYLTEKIIDTQVFMNEKYFSVDIHSYVSKPNVPKQTHANNYYYSDLRDWLNKDFIITAFSSNDLKSIKKVNVDNSAQTSMSKDNKYACDSSTDYVFALSVSEVKDVKSMITKPTDYAIYKGVDVHNDEKIAPEYNGNGIYWLRSPNDFYSYNVSGINYDGLIYNYINCYYEHVGVRCAIVLNN